MLDVDRIVIQPGFKLPESITPSANASAIPKSLYVTEAAMGDFERRLINDIAKSQGYELPMGGMAQKLFLQAMTTNGPDAAELHVVKLLEERVGHMLRP